MIEAVFFDIGGVFSRWESKANHRCWGQQLGIAPDDLTERMFGGTSAHKAYLGQIPEEEHWLRVGAELGLTPEQADQLRRDIYGDFIWDSKLIEYAKALRPRYKTGVISGAFANARREIAVWLDDTMVDCLMFSAEEGVNKPDPEIYWRALRRLGVEARHSVFIDDRLECVRGAQAVGMQGILFKSPEQCRADIEALLKHQAV
jgi:putative hydrolase of the HAD superfamily